MIYRVVGESTVWVWSEESGAVEVLPVPGRVAAGARASGRTYRVLRRKNPPRSAVAYRDDWQVALLPDRD